jgi:cytosine/adenosine deaminase-related metal-dependent hydrolase
MRGLIPQTTDFPTWIRAVIALQRKGSPPGQMAEAARSAIQEARCFGTALVGDISNTLTTPASLIAEGMPGVVFHELIGFRDGGEDGDVAQALERLESLPANPHLRYSLAAHAPYSVSPRLFQAIAVALSSRDFPVMSVHLGESMAECEFLERGTGPWKRVLEDVGAWNPAWTPPGCGPVEYLERMGLIDDRTIAVHGVRLQNAELERLRRAGTTLVTCPRGNALTGAGAPPIARFYQSGITVAVGTDSLASVPDLNLFAELAEMRKLAPDVPARALLESATVNGARALGFNRELGTLEAGKRAGAIAVDLGDGTSDVEESLVRGIEASQIQWI